MDNPTPNFVTAILQAERAGAPCVLMIHVQGADDPQPYWSLPGGRVEKGETAEAALIREVAEETGLHIDSVGVLAYAVWIHFTDFEALACVYTVEAWHGDLAPDDPEEEILSVAWVPLPQAIAHLKVIDYLPMSEPPISYLSGIATAGAIYRYHVNEAGAVWVENMD